MPEEMSLVLRIARPPVSPAIRLRLSWRLRAPKLAVSWVSWTSVPMSRVAKPARPLIGGVVAEHLRAGGERVPAVVLLLLEERHVGRILDSGPGAAPVAHRYGVAVDLAAGDQRYAVAHVEQGLAALVAGQGVDETGQRIDRLEDLLMRLVRILLGDPADIGAASYDAGALAPGDIALEITDVLEGALPAHPGLELGRGDALGAQRVEGLEELALVRGEGTGHPDAAVVDHHHHLVVGPEPRLQHLGEVGEEAGAAAQTHVQVVHEDHDPGAARLERLDAGGRGRRRAAGSRRALRGLRARADEGEVADLHRLAVFEDLEVPRPEVEDRAAAGFVHLHLDVHQVHVDRLAEQARGSGAAGAGSGLREEAEGQDGGDADGGEDVEDGSHDRSPELPPRRRDDGAGEAPARPGGLVTLNLLSSCNSCTSRENRDER
jgi:hypothetical protein